MVQRPFGICDEILAQVDENSANGTTIDTLQGTYVDTLMGSNGCDSIVTLELAITPLDTGITLNGFTLTATATSGSYQWIDCNNGHVPIPGETNASFTATNNGNYAVILTENGCTDTSSCVFVLVNTRLETPGNSGFSISPNPHTDQFSIDLPAGVTEGIVRIFDSAGRKVLRHEFTNRSQLVLGIPGPTGIYVVQVSANARHSLMKIMKQ